MLGALLLVGDSLEQYYHYEQQRTQHAWNGPGKGRVSIRECTRSQSSSPCIDLRPRLTHLETVPGSVVTSTRYISRMIIDQILSVHRRLTF